MNAVGLDVSSVGNHEFDEGADELLRLQRGGCRTDDPGCRSPGFAGARFTYLAANVLDRNGKTLLPGTWMKKVGGATIGFIGVVPEALLRIVMPAATLLTVVAMAALGLGVDLKVLTRVGGRVTLAVTLSLLVLVAISFALIRLLGVP